MSFREELRAWLADHAPASLHHTVSTPFQGYWGGRDGDFRTADERRWFEVCLERGFTAPTWPVEFGGAGLPIEHYRIWLEELSALGMPRPLVGFGLTMIGPILLAHGTPEQKARHLPPIVRGEIRWCQGYSEPDAGSDLAALRTRALRHDDHWQVDGQKIWTSHADAADWIFCLVRTNPDVIKQAGITFLVFDMTTPGITVRPIELISGASPFCEVFFEGLKVPLDAVVGEVDRGWGVAKALLAHERGMVGESVAAGGARPKPLDGYTIRDHALEVIGLDEQGKLADRDLRSRIARSEMDQLAMRLTLRRSNERVKAGDQPGPESSIFKVVGTELNQRRWELGVEIGGLEALGWQADPYSERDVSLSRHWLRSRGNSIEGGSSEIQRNIIARRVLGLPKG